MEEFADKVVRMVNRRLLEGCSADLKVLSIVKNSDPTTTITFQYKNAAGEEKQSLFWVDFATDIEDAKTALDFANTLLVQIYEGHIALGGNTS